MRCHFRSGKVSCTPRCQLEWKLSDSKVGPWTTHSTSGLGLAKHVRTRRLWLQAARDEGQLDVVKIPTERNPTDLLTKPLPFDRIRELCELVGVEYDEDSKTLEVQRLLARGAPEVE